MMKVIQRRTVVIDFDPQAMLVGFFAGLPISALFFWGLSVGIRWALAGEQPGVRLLASFVLRSLLLLIAAYLLTLWLQPFWTITGLLLAFFVVRLLSVRLAHNRRTSHATDA